MHAQPLIRQKDLDAVFSGGSPGTAPVETSPSSPSVIGAELEEDGFVGGENVKDGGNEENSSAGVKAIETVTGELAVSGSGSESVISQNLTPAAHFEKESSGAAPDHDKAETPSESLNAHVDPIDEMVNETESRRGEFENEIVNGGGVALPALAAPSSESVEFNEAEVLEVAAPTDSVCDAGGISTSAGTAVEPIAGSTSVGIEGAVLETTPNNVEMDAVVDMGSPSTPVASVVKSLDADEVAVNHEIQQRPSEAVEQVETVNPDLLLNDPSSQAETLDAGANAVETTTDSETAMRGVETTSGVPGKEVVVDENRASDSGITANTTTKKEEETRTGTSEECGIDVLSSAAEGSAPTGTASSPTPSSTTSTPPPSSSSSDPSTSTESKPTTPNPPTQDDKDIKTAQVTKESDPNGGNGKGVSGTGFQIGGVIGSWLSPSSKSNANSNVKFWPPAARTGGFSSGAWPPASRTSGK
ncbi:hypothetical protein HK102_004942 [Quaeritorhiza haematococci]|nr:hypothetical protein HK102_004942 [Quaeritorhiza haematococci]